MTEAAVPFEQFLLWERASRDTLEVKRLYIDMAGDLVAGVVLSQIVYWHLPNREGCARLQIQREGKLWLAKGRAEWWDECRVSPKQADRALEVLEGNGLIEVRLFKFGKAPRKHIRIRHDEFLRAWKCHVARSVGDQGPGQDSAVDFAQRSKSRISPKGQNRFRPKVKIQGFHPLGKILDTETTTETTAACKPARKGRPGDAAAVLVEELVSHGVGRTAATSYAREKPATCRRCLEYLPYAKFKTTKGAWLANAIRDEYGPPPGYEEEKARLVRKQEAESKGHARKALQAHERAIREEKTARLRVAYRRLEKTRGEAFLAFCAYVRQERAKIDRITLNLSPERRQELLANFDRPERRLELFAAWMDATGGVPSPQAASPRPEGPHSPPGGP